MGNKDCKKCGEAKSVDCFARVKKGSLARRSECNECSRLRIREWREKNRLRHRSQARGYYHDNKEHKLALAKKYRHQDPSKHKEAMSKYRATDRAIKLRREYAKKYYRSTVKGSQKQWARDRTRAIVKAGGMAKLPCLFCGETKVHAHHWDYHDPRAVAWLCVKHHKLIHRATKESFGGSYEI